MYFKPADRLVTNSNLDAAGFFGGVYKFDFDLSRVNRQICAEARRVWRRENVFVKVATPWPSAGMYQVYLSATDGRDLEEMEGNGIGTFDVSSVDLLGQSRGRDGAVSRERIGGAHDQEQVLTCLLW